MWLPELQPIVYAWELRVLLAGGGMVAAFVILYLRSSSSGANSNVASSRKSLALRLFLGCLASAVLWIAVDLIRGEEFFLSVWAEMLPLDYGLSKAQIVIIFGWLGWTLTFSQLFGVLAGLRQREI